MNIRSLKVDLHVHSKYSTRPSEWILRKIGCSESYTDPKCLYKTAKARGMGMVTITDHNTLAGSLDIAHLDDTFISEEITTYFPEDRCKLHLLVHDITEKQHEDITKIRENIFELVPYLNKEGISHAVAHPLYSINDKLSIAKFEQMLLLFNVFELNGSRDNFQNQILREIVTPLTPDDIQFLADKHGIDPYGTDPWNKRLIAGSDDHSSINIATTWTEVEGVSSIREFLSGIREGKARTSERDSSPKTLAHTLYSIAYQFYRDKLKLDRYIGRELLFRFVDRTLMPPSEEDEGLVNRLKATLTNHMPRGIFNRSAPNTMTGLLQREAREILTGNVTMNQMLKASFKDPEEANEAWYEFVVCMSDKIFKQFADSIMDSFLGANLFHIFNTVGSAGALYTMLAPYFVAYTVFTKDRQFCSLCRNKLGKTRPLSSLHRQKLAHFTDTFYEVNGVAKTLQMHVKMALKNNKQQTILTCSPEPDAMGIVNFTPIGTFDLPEYPDLKLYYPPLLTMLQKCYEEDYTHIHSATPGPLGIAALIIARILKRPICSTYHTALPQYVAQLTEDPAMEEIMWRYVLWYYNQMDLVYVPSRAMGEELERKGIPKEKIQFYSRGIDNLRFHPSKRNGFFKQRYNLKDDVLKLLYVGRVSKEKNMTLIEDVFRRLCELRKGVHLVIIGEGPYHEEMKKRMSGLPVTFTGFIEGEDLSQAYASGDIFIFPSTTDTFGNVVLEAQASGLPVVVTDEGGPKENLISGETGYVVPARDQEKFRRSLMELIDNPSLLQRMKKKAREYTENKSFEDAYIELWNSHRNLA